MTARDKEGPTIAASQETGSDTLTVADMSTMDVMRRLFWEILWPNRRIAGLTLVAMALSAATSGAVPFLMQVVADEVFVAKNEVLLYLLPVAIIAVMSVRGASDWVSKVSDAWLGNTLVADLRIRMFDTLTSADLAWVQRTHSGRFVSAFVNDAPVVDRAAAKTMTSLVKDGLTVIFLTAAMFYMDWRLALIVSVGIPFAYLYLRRQRQRISGSVRRSLKESGDLGSLLTQTLQSLRVVKAYRQEGREAARFRVIVDNIVRYLMKTARSRAAVGPVTEALSGVGIAGAIFYGGWQGIYGSVTVGHFAGFLTAAMLTYQPLRSVAQTQALLSEGVTAASRIFAIIDHASYVTEKPGAEPLKVPQGRIVFENVGFSYDTGGAVLREFDLVVEPGAKVALVGPSGAGKSTVLNLALRFFDPTSGRILIDGQDIREATLSSVRGAMALLTQDPVLFDDTVRANIAYGSEDAGERRIVEAARAAAAHDFIMRLPQGYETVVGEAGSRLSGGEKQRIAFARAMLRDAPILLLDEPTSALDAEAEAKVQTALEGLLQGRTVLMIAHRLSTVKRADVICVMESGSIVEHGTHEELLARGGAYAKMFRTQFVGEAPGLAAAGS
ncbi:ABC transporter ATP-binding protein [Afifella sp. IM 167]|uniref:ABC transporter ATP-binding protein n=1 Tax=Afifella sp. IM 167 TaxID=2033586 RepID=UPI001CCFEB93|nr:ABC transporter ATP-binding protein [Afifella sp. IM 167]MBZ8133465.1 ABC transporter permease [Afifella sp. IM 167]